MTDLSSRRLGRKHADVTGSEMGQDFSQAGIGIEIRRLDRDQEVTRPYVGFVGSGLDRREAKGNESIGKAATLASVSEGRTECARRDEGIQLRKEMMANAGKRREYTADLRRRVVVASCLAGGLAAICQTTGIEEKHGDLTDGRLQAFQRIDQFVGVPA